MNFKTISDRLQNPVNEATRIEAFAELKKLMIDATELYHKYRHLGRDWTKEVKSKIR